MQAVVAETERRADVPVFGVFNRMAVATLALAGVLVSAYMTAHRAGLIGHLACGAGGCQTVQNSPWAVFAGIPVPVIGLVGYGVLFIAAMLAVQPGFAGQRLLALLIAAGATVGLLFSGYLTYLEAFVIHAWCRWCIGSAVLAVLIFVFALPEFRRLGRLTT